MPAAKKTAPAAAPAAAPAPAAAEAKVGAKLKKRLADSVAARAGAAALPTTFWSGVRQGFVDRSKIRRRDGWNNRFDFGDIELLAGSIAATKHRDPSTSGLLNDIRVRPVGDDCFELVDGDRRLTAIDLLIERGETFPLGIPCKFEAADADDLELLVRMFTANTGKPLLPLEEADAFKRMRDAGMTIAQIEEATGRSDNVIVGALALLEAPEELRDAVKSGEVSAGVAKSIAVNARGDKDKQRELAAAAKAAGKDKKKKEAVRLAIDDERRKKAAKKGLKLKMRALTDAQLSALGAKMSEVLMQQMSELGLPADADLVQWVRESGLEGRIGYTFGVLQGLKAAAGIAVDLVVEA